MGIRAVLRGGGAARAAAPDAHALGCSPSLQELERLFPDEIAADGSKAKVCVRVCVRVRLRVRGLELEGVFCAGCIPAAESMDAWHVLACPHECASTSFSNIGPQVQGG